MIAKQTKGKSFRRLLNYLHEKPNSYLLGGNMAGETPRILAAEFRLTRQLNPDLEKAAYHASLSLPPEEKLNDYDWNALAKEYMDGMGFNNSQYVVYRHQDKDHDHIHIVASRIRVSDGTTVSDSWDYVRSEKLVRELEQKYQLKPTLSSRQKLRRGQTTGEQRLIERTKEASVRLKLQNGIDKATQKSRTMPELINHLKEQGIDAKISVTRTGKIRGISYQLDGIGISGTHLGKAYTFPGLQKHRQVSYDQRLQYQELIEASERKPRNITLEEKERELNQEKELVRQQQRERSLIIAPILREVLREVGDVEAESGDYQIILRSEEQTLYMYQKSATEPKLQIKYQSGKFLPTEKVAGDKNQSYLTEEDVKYWQEIALKLNSYREEMRLKEQKKKLTKRLKL